MKKGYLWFLALAVIFCAENVFGGTEVNKIISLWHKSYNELSTYTAGFSQHIYFEGEIKQEISGKIFYKKPNFFRWEVTSPEPQIIIGDGETVSIYLPKYKQIVQRKCSSEETFGPFWFSSGEPIEKIKEFFLITKPFSVKSGKGSIEVLNFQPRMKIADLKEINLYLEPGNFLPLKMEIFLKNNIVTKFIYKDIEMDVLLSPELFELKVSDDVEIFEE